MKGVLPFKFTQNKLALVQKENKKDYKAIQYLVNNDWNLVVTKCMDPKGSQTWQLKQKMSGGQLRNLVGIEKVYHDMHAKNPKLQS